MMNSSCPPIRKRFVEYLYEELPEDQTAFIKDHLEHCPDCKGEFEHCQRVLHTIDAAMRGEKRHLPTAGLLQRINWQMDHQSQYQRPEKTSRISIQILALAASFLFGIFAAPFLFSWYSRQSDQTPGRENFWIAPRVEAGQLPGIDLDLKNLTQQRARLQFEPKPTETPTPAFND